MNYKAPRSQDIDAKGSTQEARIQAVKGIKGSGGSPENGRIKLGTQDRFYLGLYYYSQFLNMIPRKQWDYVLRIREFRA